MGPLDVLLIESHAGAGHPEREALERAGHRVHRCHDGRSTGFPCVGLTDPERCPVGRVDVALLVRRGVCPNPTNLEQGVRCVIRRRVPLVEEGTTVLDPFEPFLTSRVRGGVAASVERASEQGLAPLRAAILDRVRRPLGSAGVPIDQIDLRLERRGTGLRVELTGPDVPPTVRGAVGVRVLDAIRSDGRTWGHVDVSFAGPPP